MRLTEHLRSAATADTDFAAVVALEKEFDGGEPSTRREVAGRLAEHWESIATRAEQSAVTRAWFCVWSPAEMRAEAAAWRGRAS